MRIVLIATSWGAGDGGINSFNYSLAKALATIGPQVTNVYCAVTRHTEEQVTEAIRNQVGLIPISSSCGDGLPNENCCNEILSWLQSHGLERPDLWIGHDTITGPAALAGGRLCGRVALIHHMSYIEYYNAIGGQGERTLKKHREQRKLFSSEGAIVFGVGPKLAEDAKSLGSAFASPLIPGLPDRLTKNVSSSRTLHLITAGRFDESSETLKQSRLAARGFGRAVKKAGVLPALVDPRLVIFGLSQERLVKGELENLAIQEAGRRVTVVPGPFDSTPGVLLSEMAASNLAIMPSFHEGFGLVGWEAIGCAVPLILGRATGVYEFIEKALGGEGTGCLKMVPFQGGASEELDIELISNAIIEVAQNLDQARRNAEHLRMRLEEKGYTWRQTALSLLKEVAEHGQQVPTSGGSSTSSKTAASAGDQIRNKASFVSHVQNYFLECAELNLSAGQGSTPLQFDVIAELRFGITPLAVDDLSVEVFVRRAFLRLKTDGGKLLGDRLGEGRQSVPGIHAMAGGVWLITNSSANNMLSGKILGDEVLCRVEAQPGSRAGAMLEVTASRGDLGCNFALASGEDLTVTTRKVMEVFLKKALLRETSGHVVLSEAELRGSQND